MSRIRVFIIGLFMFAALASVLVAQDLKPEEIIAKHLDAIGKKATRDSLKTMLIGGRGSFEAKNPVVRGGGQAMVVSNPDNLYFMMTFKSNDYPFEKVGYFTDKVSIPFVNSGKRSLLGSFLAEHSKVLSDGLFGGVMSMKWPLMGSGNSKLRLRSLGTKKIDDKKVYAVDFLPSGSGSSDFNIKLYFDAETFRHVRSEYRREFLPGAATFGTSNQIAGSTLSLTENFSDFRTVEGLTLPYAYSVRFNSNTNAAMYENTWGITVVQYIFNQNLTPDFFTFDAK